MENKILKKLDNLLNSFVTHRYVEIYKLIKKNRTKQTICFPLVVDVPF